MTPIDRKVELIRRHARMSEIARRLGVSANHVSKVVAGERRSPRVEEAVAEAIGRPLEEVFEPAPERPPAAAAS